MKINQVLLILLICMAVNTANVFKKVVVDDPQALCLDGTPGIYYAHQGLHRNKVIISFESGGWCGSSEGLNETIQDCLERSQGYWGTTKYDGDTWNETQGMLSDNYQNEYRQWSMFHLRYCDGTGHQGYLTHPINYKGNLLYFRGHNITLAQLDSLQRLYKVFSTATEVIITGQSAGGLSVFYWSNYIANRVLKTAKVRSIADSGIFLDFPNLYTGVKEYSEIIKNFMKISNEEIDVPLPECVAAYPDEQYKCMLAQYLYPFVKVPLYVIQSSYDSWSLPNILGISCQYQRSLGNCTDQEIDFIEQYHSKTSMVLRAIGMTKTNGYWSPACSNHVYSTSERFYDSAYRIPANTQFSLVYCVNEWYSDIPSNYNRMDNGNWPINEPCSGLFNQIFS